MIKCVIFDFGDTLVITKRKTMGEHVLEYARFLKKHGYRFNKSDIVAAHKVTEEKWRVFGEETKQTSKQLWEKTFIAALGVKPTKKLCSSMEKDYFNFRLKNDKLVPNALQILNKLKQAGLRLCVVTNTKTNANYILAKKFGLFKYFDYFLMSHKEGTPKSELKIFYALLRKLNKNKKNKIKPNECLMVGNSLNEDTVASQIGMKTAILTKQSYVDKKKKYFEPNYYIDDLKEILIIVDKFTEV